MEFPSFFSTNLDPKKILIFLSIVLFTFLLLHPFVQCQTNFFMNWLVNAEKFNGYPFQLCSCLVITKMVEQVPISCLDLFQHQRFRLQAYGLDCQLGAASVQTVDHGGQALHVHLQPVVGLCFFQSNIITLLIYIFFLTLTNFVFDFYCFLCFFHHLFQSLFVLCCLMICCFLGRQLVK